MPQIDELLNLQGLKLRLSLRESRRKRDWEKSGE